MKSFNIHLDAQDLAPESVIPIDLVGLQGQPDQHALIRAGAPAPVPVAELGPYEIRAPLADGRIFTAVVTAPSTEPVLLGDTLTEVPPPLLEMPGHQHAAAVTEVRTASLLDSAWMRTWTWADRTWEPTQVPVVVDTDGPFTTTLTLQPRSVCAVQCGASGFPARCTLLPPALSLALEWHLTENFSPSSFDAGLALRLRPVGPMPTRQTDSHYLDSFEGFLAAGYLDRAQLMAESLIEDAIDDWKTKAEYPLPGLLAAYFLLYTCQYDRLEEWSSFFADNVCWLSDAAVIRASLLVETGRGDSTEVPHRLRQALHGALPVRSSGLRRLHSLLDPDNPFVADNEELRQACTDLRPYADAAYWETPWTTFRGTPPSPSTVADYDIPSEGHQATLLRGRSSGN
ncbi:hypothetical protein [Streptomyces iakyrus]|uniref:hypothetical protein n=1 Tax=Streptomyces iakyrus TaxID=68219 RepID=UPI003D903D1C